MTGFCTTLAFLFTLGLVEGATVVSTNTPLVEATLTSSRKGWLRIEVKNTSTNPVRLVDVREGTGLCDKFWRVEIELGPGKTLRPIMFYAPADTPHLVTIDAGKTYVREIQPGAYVESYHPKSNETALITVHYEVKEPERWTKDAEPHLRFSTNQIKVRLSKCFD